MRSRRWISNARSLLFPGRCSALLFFALTAVAFAQQPVAPIAFTLDPTTTSVRWTLDTTLHTVHGSFKLRSGAFRVDPATGEASGAIVIDAASGESGDSARDRRMHSDVLESVRYAAITFRPTHVDGTIDLAAGGTVKVSGTLNLHGQDHPLQITVQLHPQAKSVSLTTSFSVPFVAWGLKDPSTFIFRTGKQVALDVESVATPVAPAAIKP